MARAKQNPVTLDHETATTVARILTDYARGDFSHAKRTQSAAIREYCTERAREADRIAEIIYRQATTYVSNKD